jgi:CRISPR/Cas system-associated exonuclease Cas4 (RecB family)
MKPDKATPATIRTMVAEEFERLIEKQPAIISILDALKLQPAPENLVRQAEFVSKSGVAYKCIQAKKADFGDSKSPKVVATDRHKLPLRFGSEVPLESTGLDLMGRADRVEWPADSTLRIVEYKTGSVRSMDTGEPRPEFWMQVGAYALMAIEKNCANEAVLRIVTPDRTWDRVFSPAFRAEISALLDALRTRIPRDKSLSNGEIATPGAGCRRCSYRHVCTAYKGYAEARWSAGDGEQLPLDIWGTITETRVQTGALIEIRLLDNALRHVRVRNVPEDIIVGEIRVGSRLRAFNLMANESGRGFQFPQNFYVADIDRPSFSAFSAALFVDER